MLSSSSITTSSGEMSAEDGLFKMFLDEVDAHSDWEELIDLRAFDFTVMEELLALLIGFVMLEVLDILVDVQADPFAMFCALKRKMNLKKLV